MHLFVAHLLSISVVIILPTCECPHLAEGLAVDLARMAVGLFITLARQSGTCCQMNLEFWTVSIALHGFWRQFYSAATSATSATSALEVFINKMRYIIPRFTYLLTYILTYIERTDKRPHCVWPFYCRRMPLCPFANSKFIYDPVQNFTLIFSESIL